MPATQPKAASKDLAKNVKEARVAARAMAALSAADRDKALSAMRASLEQQRDVIEKANALDIANAKTANLAAALQGRLNVSGKKFDGMLSKVDEVKAVPDPLGVVSRKTELDKGLELSRVACPIGVICVIFESRPEAAVQIASLTIRSGNAVILKGGKEAANTNAALVHAMQCGLAASGVMPASAVQLVQTREEISELLDMHGQIDLIVPRGSNELVSHIMKNTSIPVPNPNPNLNLTLTLALALTLTLALAVTLTLNLTLTPTLGAALGYRTLGRCDGDALMRRCAGVRKCSALNIYSLVHSAGMSVAGQG